MRSREQSSGKITDVLRKDGVILYFSSLKASASAFAGNACSSDVEIMKTVSNSDSSTTVQTSTMNLDSSETYLQSPLTWQAWYSISSIKDILVRRQAASPYNLIRHNRKGWTTAIPWQHYHFGPRRPDACAVKLFVEEAGSCCRPYANMPMLCSIPVLRGTSQWPFNMNLSKLYQHDQT